VVIPPHQLMELGFNVLTQNRLFWGRFSQPISWLVLRKLPPHNSLANFVCIIDKARGFMMGVMKIGLGVAFP